MPDFTITEAGVRHERIPIAYHVRTAFGVMKERHAVLLLLKDETGCLGVGESWVNFPIWAPWERIATFEHAFIPYLQSRHIDDIPSFVAKMYQDFVGPACQSGTIAPLVQALCAVELALWDIEAQISKVPLAYHLFRQPHAYVRVYASGINSPITWDLIDKHLDLGVTLFKLKLGFGDDEDRRNIEAMSNRLRAGASLAVDVNRGWTLARAQAWLPILKSYNIQWVEEPLTAADEAYLDELREISGIPIAGGENLLMPPDMNPVEIAKVLFDVLQPDLTKYAPLHVAKQVLQVVESGRVRVVPHFLGSGPGQAASLQFAAGCPDGLVELDINRNPLRTDLLAEPFDIVNGAIKIPDTPGIGWRLK